MEIFPGDRFGLLTVVREMRSRTLPGGIKGAERIRQYLCDCDCGAEYAARRMTLVRGDLNSCGCIKAKKAEQSGRTRSFLTWRDMCRRCKSPKDKAYPHYGGRGISVSEEWETFEGFYTSMGDRPEGMTLERDDVNGNYEESNCRWIPAKEQARNRRKSILSTEQVIEFKTLYLAGNSRNDLAKRYGISPAYAYQISTGGCWGTVGFNQSLLDELLSREVKNETV